MCTWTQNTTDIQVCLTHICPIHEHVHGGLHYNIGILSSHFIAARPQSNCLCTGVILLDKQSGAEYRWHLIVRVKHFDAMGGFCKVYSFP